MKGIKSIIAVACFALIGFAVWGCDTSCENEGEIKCLSSSIEVCKDKEWDTTKDCYTDYCEGQGYDSGECVDDETGVYCKCE